MLRTVALTAFTLALGMLAALADSPVGRYAVQGNNPGGGGNYRGTVTVELTGETYRVTWDIGSQTFIGTGIGGEDGLAVAYRSGNQTGIAFYDAKGANWEGVWTYTGGRQVGKETWTRQ